MTSDNRGTEGSEPAATPALADPRLRGVRHQVVRTDVAGSPEESAALQGIPLGALLRTIVVRRGEDDYVFVLVPGGRRFEWPKLRSLLGVRRLSLPDADEARAATGYERGAITPFGSARPWPPIATRRSRTSPAPAEIYGRNVPDQTCHASSVLAMRLSSMYVRSPYR